MKVLRSFCFAAMFISSACCAFGADIIASDVNGDVAFFRNDKIVLDGVTVNPNNLFIENLITVENHGNIQTNINITDGAKLYLRNTGNIDSVFSLGSGATLYHKITNQDELKWIDFGVNYTTYIDSTDMLSLTDVVAVANDSDKIFIQNTTMTINGMPDNTSKHVELGENVTFVLDGFSGVYEGVVLEYVSGTSNVVFVSGNENEMFSDYGYIKNNKLYVGHVRETDYEKIFNNDLGRFLNKVRMDNSSDSLFVRMDNALSMHELKDIMQESVLFNPDVLFATLRIMNDLNFADMDNTRGNVSGNLFGFNSDNFYAYGIGAKIGFDILENLDGYASVQLGTIEYLSDIDAFGGELYGLNIGARYTTENNMFLRGDFGLFSVDTDMNAVFYNNKKIEYPCADSGYLNIDVGRVLSYDDNITISPFVGLRMENYSVGNYSESDTGLYAGADIDFDVEYSGIKYVYALRSAFDTDMTYILNGKIGFWSVTDALGGDVSLSLTNSQDVMSYKISVNTQISF